MRMMVAIFVHAVVLSAVSASAEPSKGIEFFDKPLKVDRIELPKDQFSGSPSKPALSCFHYVNITAKQIDTGSIGADQISLVPNGAGQATTTCSISNVSGEAVLNKQEWGAYFWGVRGGYAFIEAADGWQSGASFAVYTVPGGEKVFEDAAGDGLSGVDQIPNGIELRYRRVYLAPCSLYADPQGCWDKVKQETKLTGEAPDCASIYFAAIAEDGKYAQEVPDDPSILEYEAVTRLEGTRSVTKPLPGKLECRLPD